MQIENVVLRNFRNYASLQLKVAGIVNIIYGNNAQGKTNFLEALYYTALGFSFRTRNEDELMSFGAGDAFSELTFRNQFGSSRLSITRNLAARKKKVILLDDDPIAAREQYGLVNVVLFAPDDLQVVKGEPGLRRKFLDMEIAQTSRLYYELLVKYNKILAQRNKFLKDVREQEKPDLRLLKVWDIQLAQIGAQILLLRQETLEQISHITAEIYAKLTNDKEKLSLDYVLKTSIEESTDFPLRSAKEWESFYLEELAKRQRLDMLRGSTSIGPHRDDLLIKVNGNNLRSFGSQGQQRSAALALKLAELEFIKTHKEEYPVLLLDDVMSELDSTRRQQLLTFIDGRVQTFITVNDKALVGYLPDSKYFYVENGQLKEE